MRGIAKTLFEETYKKTPWKERQGGSKTPSWTTLEYFLSIQGLSYLDFALAERVWREHTQISEEVASFICHLTLAARQGHLCIKIDEHNILPDVASLWSQDASTPPSQESIDSLNLMIIQGKNLIPAALMTHCIKDNFLTKPSTLICRLDNSYYLQKHWVFESLLLMHLKRVLSRSPSIEIDSHAVNTLIRSQLQQGSLLPEQAEAIKKASQNSLSIVIGGPGTGKTYTAGLLIKIFLESLTPAQRSSYEIVLAAPTGKAASNLQKSLASIVTSKPLVAKTLHTLLNIGKNGIPSDTAQTTLSADLILIDESSMIDIQMMAYLFGAIKNGARIILLGDQKQLPSVEAGGILADLIRCPNIACTELKRCMRTELQEIVDFASAINAGDSEKALSMLGTAYEHTGISRLSFSGDKTGKRLLIQHLEKAFTDGWNHWEDPMDLMEKFNRVRILSPLRKGPYGVEELNALLLSYCRKKSAGMDWFAAPILIISNDYRQDLYNGETGILVRSQTKDSWDAAGKGDYALFPSKSGGEVRRIPAILLPKYEYAYCLSIHKSQGSEFDRVILLLPEGSEWFGREILYTAVTRAKKRLEVYGEDAIIKKVIERQCQRLSGIPNRLSENPSLEYDYSHA